SGMIARRFGRRFIGLNIYTGRRDDPSRAAVSRQRPVDRGTRGGEEPGPALGDVEAVFQPDPELAVDGDGGLVAEAHARGQLGGVAPDEVGPLVPVHPDA